MHRRKRLIEPEAVFEQAKSNKRYNCFRYFNSDSGKVMMDFAIFAIAFNIGKLQQKEKYIPPSGQNGPGLSNILIFFSSKSRKPPHRCLNNNKEVDAFETAPYAQVALTEQCDELLSITSRFTREWKISLSAF
jgi:hypothetical protein